MHQQIVILGGDMSPRKIRRTAAWLLTLLSSAFVHAQGTVPTFKRTLGTGSYTLAGRDPAQKGTTVIPTVLVPVTLTFPGKTVRVSAEPDVPRILKSPVFSKYAFSGSEKTQYADALLHATFPTDKEGHTRLGKPEVKPVTIAVPVGNGYLLTSKSSGRTFAVMDSEFVEKEIFRPDSAAGRQAGPGGHAQHYLLRGSAMRRCAAGGGRMAWMRPQETPSCWARTLPMRPRL